MNTKENEQILMPERRLGAFPPRVTSSTIFLRDFLSPKPKAPLPEASNFWKAKSDFPLRTFGNTKFGDCTRAKQAIAAMRMERLETGKIPDITDDEVIRVYQSMEKRLYGGGDNGAFEEDALSEWRNPDLTFRDTAGNPITIDAYLRINHTDVEEIKRSLLLSKAHGIALCLNLPKAFASTTKWEIPKGQTLTGDFLAGSWSGHSIVITDYAKYGVRNPTTWGIPDIWISWDAVLAYSSSSHLFIDSVDKWLHKKSLTSRLAAKIKSAVNAVSSLKIK